MSLIHWLPTYLHLFLASDRDPFGHSWGWRQGHASDGNPRSTLLRLEFLRGIQKNRDSTWMPRFLPFIFIMLTPSSSNREAEAACEEPSVSIDGPFGLAGLIDECCKRV